MVNSDHGKLESSFVLLTKKISKFCLIGGSRNFLLFINELILRWPKNKLLICFLRKSPALVKPSISLSVATESSDTSVFTIKFSSHRYCSSGVVMGLVCHVISQDHMIDRRSNIMVGSPSWQVNSLQSLVAIGTVVVET